MSGEPNARGPAAPIDLTDDEVRELAGDRTKRVAAVTRLEQQVPTEPVGRLETANPVPVSMTAKEIEAVQSSGRLSDAILSRLPASDVPAEAPKKAAGRPVAGPTKRPPRARPSK